MKRIARDVLMDVLEDRELTASDLVAITGLAPAAVTTGLYHLRKMGLLNTETFRMAGERGRPRAIYSLVSVA